MEFSVGAFTRDLLEMILDSNQFPFMRDEELDKAKHSKREPLHLREAIKNTTVIAESADTGMFDIGSEQLERTHPYYHILENSPVIRKRDRATKKTKGSQAAIEDVGKRDYEKVSWNGKTFTKEYSRNVRGSRKRITSVSHWTEDYGGRDVFVNREANAYLNTHYKYIEEILNGSVLDKIAMKYGLKRKRTVDTGLAEEYFSQEDADMTNILDIIGSHD